MREHDDDQRERRERMVTRDIESRGISDPNVLDAMRRVPRERFVPERLVASALDDNPLPIGEGQTISQPLMVAIMVEAAEITATSRVLEVGTGSGYGAAVLGQIAGTVWTIERHESLAETARELLAELSVENVRVVHGDGTLGLPDEAPFDAIIVTAGARAIPDALLDQLADGGRLIIPVGPDARTQRLVRVRRHGDETTEDDLGSVRFVPLIGDRG